MANYRTPSLVDRYSYTRDRASRLRACVAFVPLSGGLPLSRLPLSAALVLSLGATLGIAAMVVVRIVPTRRLHLRLRPRGGSRPEWHAGPAASRSWAWAWAGACRYRPCLGGNHHAGQRARINRRDRHLQLHLAGVQLRRRCARPVGGGQRFPGSFRQDGAEFDRTCAGSTRAVLLLSWLGTAVIVAVAVPAAHVLAGQVGGHLQHDGSEPPSAGRCSAGSSPPRSPGAGSSTSTFRWAARRWSTCSSRCTCPRTGSGTRSTT